MATEQPIELTDALEHRVIKRYSNRKLYDTKDSRYVTLQQIGELVRQGEHVQIVDNKTKEDKTEVTLALVISEELKTKRQRVPLGTLRTLIQKRGERFLTQLRDGPIGRLITGVDDEQALGEDEFLNLNRLPEEELRAIHRRIYQCYQPGPVMDFNHFPEHFQYHHPIADDGSQRSVDYAGEGWRSRFSIAGAPLVAGSERYTLDKVGAPGMAEIGAAATTCGAKKMESEQQP